MNKNIELIDDLIKQAEQITYSNKQSGYIQKRAEMLIRKIFGDNIPYLKDLKEIKYIPLFLSFNTSHSTYEESFNNGKMKLLNLLKVILEDIQLDSTLNEVENSHKTTTLNSTKVFIVHGHDEAAKLNVARFIEKLKFEAIILHEQVSSSQTIIEKLEKFTDVGYGIVIYTPCDIGAKKGNQDNLQNRARQNVVFEHGYLIAKLGRSKVCALVKEEIEKPNDISGIVYVIMDDNKAWKIELAKELKNAGYKVDMNLIE